MYSIRIIKLNKETRRELTDTQSIEEVVLYLYNNKEELKNIVIHTEEDIYTAIQYLEYLEARRELRPILVKLGIRKE